MGETGETAASGAGPTGAPSCGPCSTRWPGWDIAPMAPRNDGSDRSRVDLVGFPRAPVFMGFSCGEMAKMAKNHGKSLVYHGLAMSFLVKIWSNRI